MNTEQEKNRAVWDKDVKRTTTKKKIQKQGTPPSKKKKTHTYQQMEIYYWLETAKESSSGEVSFEL